MGFSGFEPFSLCRIGQELVYKFYLQMFRLRCVVKLNLDHSNSTFSRFLHAAVRQKELKTNSVVGIRRTSSLDAISGSYLSCQWPRDVGSYGPSVCHKSTQVS